MTNTFLRMTCLLATGLCATPALADFVYITDGRSLTHSTVSPITPTTPFADFDRSVFSFETGSEQNSTLGTNSMSGFGSAYAGDDAFNNYGASAASNFSVIFGVDHLTDFSLTGFLDSSYLGIQTLSGSLLENGIELFSVDYNDDYPSVNYNWNGQFSVGNTYELSFVSHAIYTAYHNEAWQFDLTTTEVPLPASIWLFISGIAGLIGFGNRRKTTMPPGGH